MIFKTLHVFVMVGLHLIFQQSVFVVPHLLLSMLLLVLLVVIHLSTTMRLGVTAQKMSEVCLNVSTEPTLQPVTNEHFFHHSANTESGACLDVRAQAFWRIHHQQTYFDICAFNSLAASNHHTSISTCFGFHDCEKHQTYEQWVHGVE